MKRATEWLDRSLVVGPCFALCLSQKAFDKACSHLKVPRVDFLAPGSDASTHFYTCKRSEVALVCLRPGKDPVSNLALLVHEAAHVWQTFRASIGEEKPSPEFEAYCLQALCSRLFKQYLTAL